MERGAGAAGVRRGDRIAPSGWCASGEWWCIQDAFYGMAEAGRVVVSLIGPAGEFEEGIQRAIA